MLGNSRKRGVHGRIDTLVGRHTEIHGDVRFNGGLHIDGRVLGNLHADNDSNATLSISEHGSVEGEVHVPNLTLNGTVNGDVHSTERIELSVHARVTGDVYYNVIEMSKGAAVNGKLVHQPNDEPVLALKHDSRASARSEEKSADDDGAGGKGKAQADS